MVAEPSRNPNPPRQPAIDNSAGPQEETMSYTHLITEVTDRFIGSITLNRPDSLNTFNSPMAGELTDALGAMDRDPGVRVILLKGAGKAF